MNEIVNKFLLAGDIEAVSTKGLTKDLINGYQILNRVRYFSAGTFQNHSWYFSYSNMLNFLLTHLKFYHGKNVIIFGADMSSSVYVDNKEKDILILGEGPTQGLDDTTLTAEAKYPINFTDSNRRTVLSLHYNGGNSFLFVGATKIYQFKAKDSEIKNIHCV